MRQVANITAYKLILSFAAMFEELQRNEMGVVLHTTPTRTKCVFMKPTPGSPQADSLIKTAEHHFCYTPLAVVSRARKTTCIMHI
jgi:hypothetical protein